MQLALQEDRYLKKLRAVSRPTLGDKCLYRLLRENAILSPYRKVLIFRLSDLSKEKLLT